MEPHISRHYLWFKTVKEMWDAARKMYSDLGNTSQIFELRLKLKELKIGSKSVTQYFSDLQDLWQELDIFLEENPMCTECSIKTRHNIENERVFDFLAGLNRNLDEVRWRVVACDPFPSTEEAFADVRREEARRNVMLTDEIIAPPTQEISALVSTKIPLRWQRQNKHPWCEHCNRPCHTKDKCWEIYGKPTNWQPRKKNEGRGYVAQF